jgi:hypothetical protein
MTHNAIREHLVEKVKKEIQNESNEQRKNVLEKALDRRKNNNFLNMGPDLDDIIQVMDDLKWIDRKRGLLRYMWRKDGTLVCKWELQRDKACQDPPYAILYSPFGSSPEPDHFETMVSPEEKDLLTAGVKKYAKIAGCLNKDGTWNDHWKGLTPENKQALVDQIREDLERYRQERSKTGGAGQ